MPKQIDKERLANKYRPFLVLFPEIEDGSRRADHHTGKRPKNCPPLDQDYHPRDVCLVLDNARLPGLHRATSRDALLDAMDANSVDYIDLIDKRGPKEVEKFWSTYSGVRDKDTRPEYKRKGYVRFVEGSGRFEELVSMQYWFAYFFDDWANVHEMDWEMVSVILRKGNPSEEPIACVYNAHAGGFRKPWKQVDRVDDEGNKSPQGSHPVAFIANGSHAAYFSDYPSYAHVAECYLGPVLSQVLRVTNLDKPHLDYIPSFDRGAKLFPDVAVIADPDANGRWSEGWRWLNFKGRWGSPVRMSAKERLIAQIPLLSSLAMFFQRPLREAGPPGPNAKGLCWEDPFDWINVECVDAGRTGCWLEDVCMAGPHEVPLSPEEP